MPSRRSPTLIGIARIGLMVLSLLTAPIIARGLGADGRGLYGAATAAYALTPVILGVGIPMVVRRWEAVDPDRARAVLRTVARILPIVAVLGACVAWLIHRTALQHLSSTETGVFALSMASTSVFLWVMCVQSVLVARSDYGRIAILQIVPGVLTTALIGLLWWAGWMSLSGVLGVYAVSTLTTGLVATAFVHPPLRGATTSVRELAVQGVRFATNQVAEVSTTGLPMLIAVPVLGAAGAGLLSIGVTLVVIPTVLGFVIAPVVFKAISTSDITQRNYVKKVAYTCGWWGSVLVGLLLAAAVPFVVPLLFGSEFKEAVHPSLILLIGAPAVVLGYLGAQVLAAENRATAMTTAQLSGVATSVALTAVLGRLFGVNGAAGGIVLGFAVSAVGTVALSHVSWSFVLPNRNTVGVLWDVVVHGTIPDSQVVAKSSAPESARRKERL